MVLHKPKGNVTVGLHGYRDGNDGYESVCQYWTG